MILFPDSVNDKAIGKDQKRNHGVQHKLVSENLGTDLAQQSTGLHRHAQSGIHIVRSYLHLFTLLAHLRKS